MYVVMHSRRVEELREEKGLSKQELTRAARINPGTLRRAEREEPVQLTTARRISGVLDVDPRSVAQVYWEPTEVPRLRGDVLGYVREQALREARNVGSIS